MPMRHLWACPGDLACVKRKAVVRLLLLHRWQWQLQLRTNCCTLAWRSSLTRTASAPCACMRFALSRHVDAQHTHLCGWRLIVLLRLPPMRGVGSISLMVGLARLLGTRFQMLVTHLLEGRVCTTMTHAMYMSVNAGHGKLNVHAEQLITGLPGHHPVALPILLPPGSFPLWPCRSMHSQ